MATAPDVKFALDQAAWPTTIGNTVDFTIAGLGTPKGLFAWGTSSTANDAPSNNARFCMGGGVSATNRSAVWSYMGNNATTAIEAHRAQSTSIFGLNSSAAAVGGVLDFDTLETDGVQCITDDDYIASVINGLMIAGTDAQQGHVLVSETRPAAAFTDIVLPFRPTCGIIRYHNDDIANSNHQGYCSTGIGFFVVHSNNTISVVSRCISWHMPDSGTCVQYGYVSSNGIVTIDPSITVLNYDGFFTLSLVDNTTMRLTTVDATGDGAVGTFALDLYDTSSLMCQCGILTLPTGEGDYALTSHFNPTLLHKPQMLALALSTMTTVDSWTGDVAENGTVGLGIVTRPDGLVAGNGEFNSTISSVRAVTTSDTQSMTATNLFTIPLQNGATGTTGSFTSFDRGVVNVNLTASPAALKIPFMSVESPAGYLLRIAGQGSAFGAMGGGFGSGFEF